MNTQTQDIQNFDYGISLDYVKEWSQWQIIRELVSNAIDTNTEVKMYSKGKTVYIEDSGIGITIKDLFLGQHNSGDSTIGQFGEGLKIALLVAERMGIRIDVYSNNLHFYNSHYTKEGIDALRICYEVFPTSRIGTQVKIENWQGDMYQDRFILDSTFKQKEAIFTNNEGCVFESKGNPAIFVKNIFVTSDNFFQFSYSLTSMKMNRDRSTINEWECLNAIARIYETCEDWKVWKQFFGACEFGKKEKLIAIRHFNLTTSVKEAMKIGFKVNYGDVLIGLDYASIKECEHLGKKCVMGNVFGDYLRDVLCKTIGTDTDFIKEKKGKKFERISSHHIDERQKKVLGYLRKIAKKEKYNEKLIKIATMECDFSGIYHPEDDTIDIREDRLNSLENAISTFIHELAHWESSADDLTDSHVHAIQDISGRIIAGYMNHQL